MGYTTNFEGAFDITPPLDQQHIDYLNAFSQTRRMGRDAAKAAQMPDPVRTAVGLPIGTEGEYFVGGVGFMGQDSDASVLNGNREPSTQPGLWCQWVPSEDGTQLMWDQGEKFYDYTQWLEYIQTHFLNPWGRTLSGCVSWEGEEDCDTGILGVVNGNIKEYPSDIEYKVDLEQLTLTDELQDISEGKPTTNKILKI